MSYARFGPDSDVYVYKHVAGGWIVHVAKVVKEYNFSGESRRFVSLVGVRAMLNKLKNIGYKVPDKCFERIDEEMYGPGYKNNEISD